ncbi:MAG: hypothetical protein HY201_03300 [Nitrospirae bacterium]|nr:hypothetical protein [Candidatus Troglogloeales bacterium]
MFYRTKKVSIRTATRPAILKRLSTVDRSLENFRIAFAGMWPHEWRPAV